MALFTQHDASRASPLHHTLPNPAVLPQPPYPLLVLMEGKPTTYNTNSSIRLTKPSK